MTAAAATLPARPTLVPARLLTRTLMRRQFAIAAEIAAIHAPYVSARLRGEPAVPLAPHHSDRLAALQAEHRDNHTLLSHVRAA